MHERGLYGACDMIDGTGFTVAIPTGHRKPALVMNLSFTGLGNANREVEVIKDALRSPYGVQGFGNLQDYPPKSR